MTVKDLQNIALGFQTHDGLIVCDLRLENQAIILTECSQEQQEIYITEYVSKIDVLAYLLSCHMDENHKHYQEKQLQRIKQS